MEPWQAAKPTATVCTRERAHSFPRFGRDVGSARKYSQARRCELDAASG
jgi:hypothetical protein